LKEIRLHGRGGQGAKSASDIIATASIKSGKYGVSFPLFTAERRGAPMVSFARIDNIPIREKTKIYTPDCLLVLDQSQVNSSKVYEGLKPGGVLVLNAQVNLEKRPHPNVGISGVIDATSVALQELGMAAFNTCLLGAFAATTKWIELDAICLALENFFEGEVLKRNKKAAERGYKEVKITTWQ
jgi:2-oxoacid:acceptor oxidoreductase gamma subunit (pyruvate/2-ketoisovalerate family)